MRVSGLAAWAAVLSVCFCVNVVEADHILVHNYTKHGMPNHFNPVLSGINSSALKRFVEGENPVIIMPQIVIRDLDNASWPFIARATAVVSQNYQWGVDKVIPSKPLSLSSPTSPLQASWDHTEGTLVINGTATIEEYESYLRGLVFFCDSTTPKEWMRTISVSVSDGEHESDPITVQVSVKGVNQKNRVGKFSFSTYLQVHGSFVLNASSGSGNPRCRS